MILRKKLGSRTPASPGSVARGLRFARWASLAVSAVAACVGATFIGIGTFEWTRASDSATWPVVPGTITESRVVETTSTRKGRTTHGHAARIVYRYAVDGVEREGRRVSFRVSVGGREAAEATVAAYPAGRSVEVHHSPADPDVACLLAGADEWQALPIGTGAIAMAFAGGFWWFVNKNVTRRLAKLAAAA